MSPRGEVLAEAGSFRTKLISAHIRPALLRPSYLWADLNEVPAEFNRQLGNLLNKGHATEH